VILHRCKTPCVQTDPVNVHRPPWMEKDDRINTKTLINAHINGIHVDILKYPALYTAPRLENVSRACSRKKRDTSMNSQAMTYIKPTILPASKASTPATRMYNSGIAQTYCQAFLPFPSCINTANAATARWNTPNMMSVQRRVWRQISWA
jgi:hypothetical protein